MRYCAQASLQQKHARRKLFDYATATKGNGKDRSRSSVADMPGSIATNIHAWPMHRLLNTGRMGGQAAKISQKRLRKRGRQKGSKCCCIMTVEEKWRPDFGLDICAGCEDRFSQFLHSGVGDKFKAARMSKAEGTELHWWRCAPNFLTWNSAR